MKYFYFLLFILLFISISSCCEPDFSGGDGNTKKSLLYSRKIKILDSTNRIIRISYKDSDKIFSPNDTITELVISDNKENTLYIETKNDVDTIVLFVKVSYGMYSSRCESTNTNKHISHQPIIVNHTFVSAVFSPVLTEYSLSDILYLKP